MLPFFVFLLQTRGASGFIPGIRAVGKARDGICLKSSTVEIVQLQGGAEVKIRHQMQIGGLEADGDLTGLKLWPTTSEPMFQNLCNVILPTMQKKEGLSPPLERPLRILELGSGCGLLGISLASHGEEVVLTDPAFSFRNSEHTSDDAQIERTTLDHLQNNINLNAGIVEGRAKASKILWGAIDDLDNIQQEGPFDLVIGSELLYYVESFDALLGTIKRLGAGGVPIILGYKTRRLGEQKFLEMAEEYFDIRTDRLGRKNEGLFLATCILKE